MDIEISKLSTDLVTALAPVLPYLLNKTLEKAEDSISEAIISKCKAIWQRIRGRDTDHEDLINAADALAEEPDSLSSKEHFRQKVESILSDDKALAIELSKLVGTLRESDGRIYTADRMVFVDKNENSPIIMGDVKK